MTVIAGNSNLIKEAVEEDTLEEAAETVLETAEALGTLTEAVADLEQIAESEATKRSRMNLRTLVDSVVEEVIDTESTVDVTVDASEDVQIVGDEGVRYAIKEAIENAIEHNDHENPSVTVRVRTDTETDMGVVQIIDNGPKIPEMETDILADEIDTTSTYHGTGIGLWVMQWAINSLGGELRFEENRPRGNIVSIRLPKPNG